MYKKQREQHRYIRLFVVLSGILFFMNHCDSDPAETDQEQEVPGITENIQGIRLEWDYSSMKKIAPQGGEQTDYCGYARMIQLYDGRIACIYEAAPNVEIMFSQDSGQTWENPHLVFERSNNVNMAAPNLIELSDHSILVACNPRPQKPYTSDRKFGIKVCKSTDGGENWQAEQVVYEAQSDFENGCWEPAFLQLPDGEVQLYFSDEGIYTGSGEQNISMLRSYDLGETWNNTPEIIGFREGCRDGMPVPLLLEDQGMILIAIEDNKVGGFKPTIFQEQIHENWADGQISGEDSRRWYNPLEEVLSEDVYAGAPYLARLESGEVLLSYQSNRNRGSDTNLSVMTVEVGNNSGTSFGKRTTPFSIPLSKSGLWNSLSVLGNTPVALTSTTAYSETGSTEVWMIKGRVIPELVIPEGTVVIDGQTGEDCWQGEWPYFVGHSDDIQLEGIICMDEDYLYVAAKVYNVLPDSDTQNEVTFQLDTEHKGYELPHFGIFSFHCNADGTLIVEEGKYGEWSVLGDNFSAKYDVLINNDSYTIELGIPFNGIGVSPEGEKDMGVNFVLKNVSSGSHSCEETIFNNDLNGPYTWCCVLMK